MSDPSSFPQSHHALRNDFAASSNIFSSRENEDVATSDPQDRRVLRTDTGNPPPHKSQGFHSRRSADTFSAFDQRSQDLPTFGSLTTQTRREVANTGFSFSSPSLITWEEQERSLRDNAVSVPLTSSEFLQDPRLLSSKGKRLKTSASKAKPVKGDLAKQVITTPVRETVDMGNFVYKDDFFRLSQRHHEETLSAVNRLADSIAKTYRMEGPHPSSGRWESKNSCPGKRSANPRRADDSSSSGLAPSSSCDSMSPSRAAEWLPQRRDVDSSSSLSPRGPRSSESLTHQPVRGGGLASDHVRRPEEGSSGHPTGHRSGGNPDVAKRSFERRLEHSGTLDHDSYDPNSDCSESSSDDAQDDDYEPAGETRGAPSAEDDAQLDFSGMIEFVRQVHGLETPPPQSAPRDVAGFEEQVRAPQDARPSFLLPWSNSTRAKMDRVNEAIKNGALDSAKGHKLFGARAASRRKFYDPLNGFAGVSEHTQRLGTLLHAHPNDLRRDQNSFSSAETRDMVIMASSSCAAASWSDLVLASMGSFLADLSGERRRLFQNLGISLSRAISLMADNAVHSWANWELKRRDTAFSRASGKATREQLPSLRNAPLFSNELVPDNLTVTAIERRTQAAKDDFVMSRAEPPRKKFRANYSKPFPMAQSSLRREEPYASRREAHDSPNSLQGQSRHQEPRRDRRQPKSKFNKKRSAKPNRFNRREK